MQHSEFLWWVSILVLATAGGAAGVFAARTACRYDALLRRGNSPDALTLVRALRAAWSVPDGSIIWVDGPGCSACLRMMAGLLMAGVVTGLYLQAAGAQWVVTAFACLALIMMACIDMRVGLLPDALTFPLLWAGLSWAWLGGGVVLSDSFAGVVVGYGLLLLPRLLWLLRRGVEAVGLGDLKLLAALGAWIGPAGIVEVLALACTSGVIYAMVHQRRFIPSGSYPFGPFIVFGGLLQIGLDSGVQSWF